MELVEDPALRQSILDILVEEYKLHEPRSGIHASDLIYCITKSYWNKVDYQPPTESESMMFSIGLGLERVIIQFGATRVAPLFVEGVHLSPDFLINSIHSELKTTRFGVGKVPDTWIKQVMAYCYATDIPIYNLAVLHIIQAQLIAYRVVFTQEELEENWGWMLNRKEVLEDALHTYVEDQSHNPASLIHPREFTFNEDWECGYCRYKLRCDLAASIRKLRVAEAERG